PPSLVFFPFLSVCPVLTLPAGGFAWNHRGPLCALGCAHRNGGCEQECVEAERGAPPRCACHPGYVLAPDLVSCAPADGCDPNPCEGPCHRRPAGGFECGCAAGYTLAPDGRRCLDVDECLGQPCHQECHNAPGSFACTCRPGYEPEAPGSPRCRDIDECAAGAAACPQLCLNVPGSYLCACRPGFVPAADGGTCHPDPTHTEGPAGASQPTRPLAATLGGGLRGGGAVSLMQFWMPSCLRAYLGSSCCERPAVSQGRHSALCEETR
uniref:CD93 molecule n=1 Tax=Dromaius novaehollandiae TaxID=8790 RepID=A0A8C4IYT4_DRONO